MYIYIHIYIYIYIYIYICVCVCVYIYIYIYIYKMLHIYTCIYMLYTEHRSNTLSLVDFLSRKFVFSLIR